MEKPELDLGEFLTLIKALNAITPGGVDSTFFNEVMVNAGPITSVDKGDIASALDNAYKIQRIEEEKVKLINDPLFGSW